jgi:hypothetical protein
MQVNQFLTVAWIMLLKLKVVNVLAAFAVCCVDQNPFLDIGFMKSPHGAHGES